MPSTRKRRPVSDEAVNAAMGRYLNRIDKFILNKAFEYLRMQYREMRFRAMRSAPTGFYNSARDRMKATHLPISCGGILPNLRDEMVPDYLVTNVDELQSYLLIAYDMPTGKKPEELLLQWRKEAEQEIPYPKILEQIPDDGSTLEQFFENSPDEDNVITRMRAKRRKLDTSKLNCD